VAITRVQSKVSTSAAATFDSNVTAGNLIVVSFSGIIWSGTAGSMSDGLGNTYTFIGYCVQTGGEVSVASLYYAYNIAGGACTVTAANGKPALNKAITVVEYHSDVAAFSADPFDVYGTVIDSTADPLTIALTLTAAGVVVCSLCNGGGQGYSAAGSGYSFVGSENSSTSAMVDNVSAASGSNTAGIDVVSGSANNAMIAAAFKEPTASGGPGRILKGGLIRGGLLRGGRLVG